MKLTFLGTGTSMGVPVAGGFGREHPSTGDPRDERYRCSAWVQTDTASIIIDIGPEFRLQTLRAGIRRVDAVLVTHEHMDHIGGLDDLRAFNYVQEQSIPLYSTQSCLDSIRKRFDYMFGPDRYPGSVMVDMEVMNKPMELFDTRVVPLPVRHGKLDILGYRINDLAYLTDVKEIPASTRELIRGAKVMVLSGLRWGPGHPTHLTIPEAVEIAHELEIPQTYLIHMNSFVKHAEESKKLPSDVKLAYDQLTIEL